VRRVALHGLDEVGDQVVSAAELGVDVRPRVADELPLRDEPVVGDDAREHDQHDEPEHDPERFHGLSLLVTLGG